MSFEYIDKNLSEVRERIAEAERRAGREGSVMLLPAVKCAEPAEIEYLYRHAGITQVGENRVQQMLEHIEAIDCEGLEFHFIGTLQTNKVKYIIDKVKLIHSLDSLKLAAEIDNINAKTLLIIIPPFGFLYITRSFWLYMPVFQNSIPHILSEVKLFYPFF